MPSRPMEIFLKGLTYDSGQKLEFFPFLPFKQNRRWNNVSWPSSKKTSLPTLKNKDLTSRSMEIFSKGLTHDSGQKSEFFPFLPFKKNRLWNNVSWPSVYKRSLARLKNKDFANSPYGDFFKQVNPWFWSKIRIFSFASFETK